MGIAITLKEYLSRKGSEYEVVEHPRALTSVEIAAAAQVPGERLAKTVVLEDDGGYLLVVLPSTQQVQLGALSKVLKRKLRLASEPEIAQLFKDCEVGAIPPVGHAYGIDTIIAADFARQTDVYFEAGDHCGLIHMSGSQFLDLMRNAQLRELARHAQGTIAT
jgi:Ala-tRNA(Pro) deacylase